MPHDAIRRFRFTILGAVLGLMASSPVVQADIFVNAGRGPLIVRVPNDYAGESTPLVVLLHAFDSDRVAVDAYFGFTPLSESMGFIYVAPDGTVDGFGNRFWNATNACCNFGGSSVDDVGYLMDLVEAIEAQLNVDPSRIYFVGHSNGGFMAHRMACEWPDKIAAIVSLAGATYSNPASCTPASPVHVLQIHGTADGVIAYGGGAIGGQPYPGAVATAQSWATLDGCSLIPDNTAPPLDLDASIGGSESSVTRYLSGCDVDGSAELWTIPGAGHSPSLSAQFSPLVIGYLFDHPKTNVVSVPGMPSSPLAALVARPNPFRSGTELGFELPRTAKVSLTVFDLNGRRVRTLLSGATRSAGAHRVHWDATSDDGRRVVAGVYFARIDAGGASQLRKIVFGR